jgi:hypothetical protein
MLYQYVKRIWKWQRSRRPCTTNEAIFFERFYVFDNLNYCLCCSLDSKSNVIPRCRKRINWSPLCLRPSNVASPELSTAHRPTQISPTPSLPSLLLDFCLFIVVQWLFDISIGLFKRACFLFLMSMKSFSQPCHGPRSLDIVIFSEQCCSVCWFWTQDTQGDQGGGSVCRWNLAFGYGNQEEYVFCPTNFVLSLNSSSSPISISTPA